MFARSLLAISLFGTTICTPEAFAQFGGYYDSYSPSPSDQYQSPRESAYRYEGDGKWRYIRNNAQIPADSIYESNCERFPTRPYDPSAGDVRYRPVFRYPNHMPTDYDRQVAIESLRYYR